MDNSLIQVNRRLLLISLIVAGVFLAIPIAAMLKILCDHIEPLKPIGFLPGEKVKTLRSRSQSVSDTTL